MHLPFLKYVIYYKQHENTIAKIKIVQIHVL